MKKIILILIFFTIFMKITFAQSIDVSGPKYVEVGYEYKYYVYFTPDSMVEDQRVNKYEWSIDDEGVGKYGMSGIYGELDFGYGNPLFHDWTYENVNLLHHSDSIVIIWGDFDNYETNDVVRVEATYTTNDAITPEKTIPKNFTIKHIYRVWEPDLYGPASVQACCSDEFVIRAENYGDADVFEWEILSGGEISGISGNLVYVIPYEGYEDIELWCTVSRASGRADYYRESNIVIKKHTPQTPKYDYGEAFCKEETFDLCVPQICGMTGVQWDVPSSVIILSGQGTNCLTVTPDTEVPDGTQGVITYTAIMSGDCQVFSNSSEFTIYSSGVPPTPEGYIVVTPQGSIEDLDPCDPESWPGFVIQFVPTNPYVNGYTTITPGFFVPVLHHMNDNATIEIEVCYVNYCSGAQSCTTFIYELPYPCDGDGDDEDDRGRLVVNDKRIEQINSFEKQKDKMELRSDSNAKVTNIETYPNPFSDNLYFSFPFIEKGNFELVSLDGIVVYSGMIEKIDHVNLSNLSKMKSGMYILKIHSAKYSVIEKIVKSN